MILTVVLTDRCAMCKEGGERGKKLERKREDTKLILAVVLTGKGGKKEEIQGRRKS